MKNQIRINQNMANTVKNFMDPLDQARRPSTMAEKSPILELLYNAGYKLLYFIKV